MKNWVFVLLLLAWPASGAERNDQFSDGTELWALCNSKKDFSEGACLAYIVGVADAAALYQQTGYCFRDDVSRGQLRDIVVKWLAANPGRRRTSGAGIVYNALQEAFPCAMK